MPRPWLQQTLAMQLSAVALLHKVEDPSNVEMGFRSWAMQYMIRALPGGLDHSSKGSNARKIVS